MALWLAKEWAFDMPQSGWALLVMLDSRADLGAALLGLLLAGGCKGETPRTGWASQIAHAWKISALTRLTPGKNQRETVMANLTPMA